MGNARRLRRQDRKPQPAGRGEARLIRGQDDLLADPSLTGTDMPGSITYLDDPLFGSMRPAAGVSPDGTLIADTSGTEEPIPVVLFEPVKVIMGKNKITGLVQELRTEAIVACGFHRVPPPRSVWAAEPAPGWELVREPGCLVLRDGSGDVWASSQITPDPRWVSAAASRRHVIVFYGPQLGVRTPAGIGRARYTAAARAAEFRAAREQGLVSVATVPWRGQPPAGSLDWATLLPGSFGQHLPGIFAPQSAFDRHGGPAMFGLTRLDGDSPEVTLTQALTARVTRTDIDLLDPAEGKLISFIGGVHYSEGINPAWARAARRYRVALLVTGPRLPEGDYGGGERPSIAEASQQSELWAGLVPVILA
jgi:hypothetical protein